jgi:Exocyst complex component Sec6
MYTSTCAPVPLSACLPFLSNKRFIVSCRADHNKTQTADGRLVTSLCEDVYSLAGVQLRTIRERLTRRSEALVQAVGVIFKNLYEKQTKCRDLFCVDFETCCAAANDFVRMSDKCEEIVNEIQEECQLSANATETLEEQSAAILGLYSGDAVYAAKKTHVYCFEPIEEAIANELFGAEWESELTHNELSLTLVRTLDDFMEDLETFLDEVMVQKAVEAQISSSINFYIRCLLKKASSHNNNKKSCFADNEVAIARMRGDLTVMREYFDGLAETMPTLERIIEAEFSVLEAIFEILSIAAGISKSDAHDFILIVQKRVRNVAITKFVIGDLYHLVQPQEERGVYELIESMEDELAAVAPTDEQAASSAHDRNTVPGLRTDEMMAKHCDESKRSRPIKAGAMERAENALRGWRANWGVGKSETQ